MANEGEFPKSDGDVLYASEVNRFNYAPIPLGSKFALHPIYSGTNFQTIGSIVCSGTGFKSGVLRSIMEFWTDGAGYIAPKQVKLVISGTKNTEIMCGSTSGRTSKHFWNITAPIISGNATRLDYDITFSIYGSTSTNYATPYIASSKINYFNPGSNFVIYLQALNNESIYDAEITKWTTYFLPITI